MNNDTQQQHTQNKRIMAFLAYILFFIPLLTSYKNDPFVKFHVKQGLVLFIGWIIADVVGFIPVIRPFALILYILLLILWIIGIVNAFTDKQKPLPVIGGFASNFNF